jgi:thymidylate synthase (FAD)
MTDKLKELKGKTFRILDHGHLVLMDVMGSDQDIVQAARTSYQQGTKSVSDDRTLLRFLMRHNHATPFEMAQLKFHVKLPIFVERQWIRHRASSTNEMSARYSELPEEYYVPDASVVGIQSQFNKQGRGAAADELIASQFLDRVQGSCKSAFIGYGNSLRDDIARELARIELPLGTYTEKVWSADLRNLLHFLGLRMDSHAQWEIRQYANVIGQIVKELFPLTWEAFEDYRLGATSFSRIDKIMARVAIDEMIRTDGVQFTAVEFLSAWDKRFGDQGYSIRERFECLAKLQDLDLVTKDEE